MNNNRTKANVTLIIILISAMISASTFWYLFTNNSAEITTASAQAVMKNNIKNDKPKRAKHLICHEGKSILAEAVVIPVDVNDESV